jgi:hypothetical protein
MDPLIDARSPEEERAVVEPVRGGFLRWIRENGGRAPSHRPTMLDSAVVREVSLEPYS